MGYKKLLHTLHYYTYVPGRGASTGTIHLRVDFWGGRPSRTAKVTFQMDTAARTRIHRDELVIGARTDSQVWWTLVAMVLDTRGKRLGHSWRHAWECWTPLRSSLETRGEYAGHSHPGEYSS